MEEHTHQEDWIARWLNGEISDAEAEKLAGNTPLSELKALANPRQFLKAPPFDKYASWEKIASQMEDESSAVIPLIPVKSKPRFPWVYAAASAVVILVAALLFWPGQVGVSELMTHQTETGEQKDVLLPDGSTASLNVVSKISYDAGNWDELRLLQLEGEAYFAVEKGSAFTVNTSMGEVEVLGTHFSVQVRDSIFQVSCHEGRVGVTNKNFQMALNPGEGIRVIHHELREQLVVSTKMESPWADGIIEFPSEIAVFEGLKAVERQFGISIQYEGKPMSVKGFFRTTDPETALGDICEVIGLQFEKTSDLNYRVY